MKPAYFNEIDPYAAEWLRNLIAAGHLPAGDVDTRSIVDVGADDLVGYGQCHFFAGIGGWALAARIAGWRDDRELWTGSCPCQPFSVAGKGAGTDDERHLWPHQFRLIRARRPAVWMGEQVAAAVGKDWLDGVLADLEGIGYAGRAAVVPACAVDGPHRRDRLWIVADREGVVGYSIRAGLEGLAGHGDDAAGWTQQDRPVAEAGSGVVLADADGERGQVNPNAGGSAQGGGAREVAGSVRGSDGDVADAGCERRQQDAGRTHGDEGEDEGRAALLHHVAAGHGESRWAHHGWIIGHDGKARRVEPGIRLLAYGVPARVGKLRAYGNAIAPPLAAEVIAAYLDCMPEAA